MLHVSSAFLVGYISIEKFTHVGELLLGVMQVEWLDDFLEHGEDAINRVRGDKPEAYLGTIAKLMPKLMELSGPDGNDIPFSGTVKFVKSGKDEI